MGWDGMGWDQRSIQTYSITFKVTATVHSTQDTLDSNYSLLYTYLVLWDDIPEGGGGGGEEDSSTVKYSSTIRYMLCTGFLHRDIIAQSTATSRPTHHGRLQTLLDG